MTRIPIPIPTSIPIPRRRAERSSRLALEAMMAVPDYPGLSCECRPWPAGGLAVCWWLHHAPDRAVRLVVSAMVTVDRIELTRPTVSLEVAPILAIRTVLTQLPWLDGSRLPLRTPLDRLGAIQSGLGGSMDAPRDGGPEGREGPS
jgi:hypothetical protein